MSKLSGHIKEDAGGKGLWLIIENDNATHSFDVFSDEFAIPRNEDIAGGVAYAILPEEVEVIRDVCNEYIEKNSN